MSNLYFVQNMMIFLEECFVKEPEFEDCFTINPYYQRDTKALNQLRADIEGMFCDRGLKFVPYDKCKARKWETIYQSSYFEPQYRSEFLSIPHKEIVLVEDGLFDYMEQDDYDYYDNKKVYVFKPDLASGAAHKGIVNELKQNYHILERFDNKYKYILDMIADKSDGVPILYTTPLAEDFGVKESFVSTLLLYIKEEYNTDRIILKKHPRDHFNYRLNGFEVIECPQQVPGQFLDKACNGLNLFIFPSTVSFMCSRLDEIHFLNVLPDNDDYTKAFEVLKNTNLFGAGKLTLKTRSNRFKSTHENTG